MASEGPLADMMRPRDGSTWQIGTAADVDWIARGTSGGLAINSAVSTGGRNGSCGMTQEPIPEVVDAWAPERRAEAARFQTTSEWLAADGYRQRDRVFGAHGRADGAGEQVHEGRPVPLGAEGWMSLDR